MFWDVSIVGISKHGIIVTWGISIVEIATTIINACRIHRLSKEEKLSNSKDTILTHDFKL